MDNTEAYTATLDRDARESAARAASEQERNEIDFRPLWEREPVNYLVCSPNERRQIGDFAADISDSILGGVSRITNSRVTWNGPHDYDEEVEDERDREIDD